MQQNPLYGENLGNWYSYISHNMGAFFQLDSHSMVYLVTWEMHVFSHQFPITWEKTVKPIVWGRTWKIVTHTFLIVCVIFSIRFPSCGTLHQMGNAFVFSSISHNMGKDSQTHRMGETWKIITHTFPIVCVLFPH